MTSSMQDFGSKKLVDLSQKYYDERNFCEAIKCADEAIKENPYHKNAWLLKGIAMREIGRLRDAIDCFNETIKIDKDYYDAYIGNCSAFLAMGENSQAERNVDEALRIHPRLPNAVGWKGFVAHASGHYHTAISNYRKALGTKDGKKEAWIWSNLGDSYFDLGRYEEALDSYATAFNIDNKDAVAIIGMGNVILEIYGNKEESDKKFFEAMKVDQNCVYSYWIGFGVSLDQDGRSQEAIEYFNKSIHQNSFYKSLAFINKGIIFLKQKEYDKSIEYFDLAIEPKLRPF